jgi:Mg2+/Co2+ transporter CorB
VVKDNDFMIACILILLMSAFFGASIAFLLTENQYRYEAIERDYAEYCSKTGEWAWKGECDEN